ncbi:MAG: hypothetical protein WA635_08020, partial [Gallionella sp.]
AGDLLELKGVTVPIRVSGPYATPNIAFDFAAASGGSVAKLVAANAAKAAAARTAAEAATALGTVQQQKKNSSVSAPSKSRKPAGKPVMKSQP